MQRLQTYIAVLAALLVLAMLLILGAYAVIAEGAKPSIFIVMVPLTLSAAVPGSTVQVPSSTVS